MNRGVPLIAWCTKDQRRALYEKKKFRPTIADKSSAREPRKDDKRFR